MRQLNQVNADKVIWTVNDDNTITSEPRVLTRAVGLYIGTKAVGKMETENLVNNYKYKEGIYKKSLLVHGGG